MKTLFESEQLLLAGMILHEDVLIDSIDNVSVEMFADEKHRLIFNAIIDCYRDEKAVDLVLLSDHLSQQGVLSMVGGVSYLTDLLAYPPMRSGVKPHAEKVKEGHLLRKMAEFGKNIQAQAEYGGDPKELLDLAESGLIEIFLETKEEKKADVGSILLEVQQEWELVKKEGVRGIKTPMQTLGMSNPIPYFVPGHLWMIGAPSSHGKSTFMMDLLKSAMNEMAAVMVFSLEDSRQEKVHTLIANIADVTKKKLVQGAFTPEEESAITLAKDLIKRYPLSIFDNVRTLDAIRLKVKKEKMKAEVDIVAIDFVQNLRGDPDIYRRMSAAALQLQDMADELHVCLIVLSQMTDDRLKGAGELYAAADVVLFLSLLAREAKEKARRSGQQDDQVDPRWLDLVIDKNRPFGETGKKRLRFSEKWTRIEPRA